MDTDIPNTDQKMQQPFISIITVCRNSVATIQRTITSVLEQSEMDYEYIIVDGASRDGTMDIIRNAEPGFHGRLRWISEQDTGIYDAMNKGIRMAKGSLVGIINSDDWYEPRAFAEVRRAYQHRGDGVYYGALRVIQNDGQEKITMNDHQILQHSVVAHPAYFVSRNLYERHGTFDVQYRFAADYELMLRFLWQNVPFHRVDRIIASYSLNGLSSKYKFETWSEYLTIRYRYGSLSLPEFVLKMIKNRAQQWITRIHGGSFLL